MNINPFDRLLEEKGIKYEDLTPVEKETYLKAGKDIKAVDVDELHTHVKDMMLSLLVDLCTTPDTKEMADKNRKLKARVHNYLLLDAFISAPHKTAEHLRKQIDKTI